MLDTVTQFLAHNVEPHDFIVIAILVVLEGVLSADNAVALAAMTKGLPTEEEQVKALNWSIWGSYALRIICVVFATFLISHWWFKAAGAAYLLYLAVEFAISEASGEEEDEKDAPTNFWWTVVVLFFTDAAFSIDSVAASVGVSKKVWVILAGAMIGIALLRFAAKIFIGLLDIYSRLESAAYIMVGYVGLTMALETAVELSEQFDSFNFPGTTAPEWLLYIVMVAAFAWGFSKKDAETQEMMTH